MNFRLFAATLLLAIFSTLSHAQSYPAKQITFVVPFAPGGGIDVLTRAVGAKLSELWKQPVLIENKPGAGSLMGTSFVAKAAPDGYTLLATVNQTMVGNRFLYKNLPYDPDKGFEPITKMVEAEQIIVANKKMPANNLRELVDLAKKQPGTINYGSFGNGSQPHLLFSLINDREKIDLMHVPYNGITPNLTALAAGDVQLASASAGVIASLVDAGKIKPIAVAGDSIVGKYPGVTTTTAQGFPYAKASIWYGLFAPAGTPPAVVKKIRDAIHSILTDPQFAEENITARSLNAVASTGRQLRDAMDQEAKDVAAMIKAAGVVAE